MYREIIRPATDITYVRVFIINFVNDKLLFTKNGINIAVACELLYCP